MSINYLQIQQIPYKIQFAYKVKKYFVCKEKEINKIENKIYKYKPKHSC